MEPKVVSSPASFVVHTWEGMPHVFPASVGALDAADAALDMIDGFLSESLAARLKPSIPKH